jgi:hypothetical protein
MHKSFPLASFALLSLGCTSSAELGSAVSRGALVPADEQGSSQAGACSGSSPDASGEDSLRLNEIVIDPPGADGNNEFVEIEGAPCRGLGDAYLVCIEGDSESNPGSVDRVVGFQGTCDGGPCLLGPDGLAVVFATNGWEKPDASNSTWLATSALAGGGLENGTTTLLLVECSKAPTAGQDWDPANTGTLQIPADCRLVDSLAWVDRISGDFPYSSRVLGPKPAVGGAVRCDSPSGDSEWYFGVLGIGAAEIEFTASLSSHAPPDAMLTPGMPNHCAPEPLDSGSTSPEPLHTDDAGESPSSTRPTTGLAGGSGGQWWQPDAPGTWPAASNSFDAGLENSTGGAPTLDARPVLSEPSCSVESGRFGPSWRIGAVLTALAAGIRCRKNRRRLVTRERE